MTQNRGFFYVLQHELDLDIPNNNKSNYDTFRPLDL